MNLIVKPNGKLLVDDDLLKVPGDREWQSETFDTVADRGSLAEIDSIPGVSYIVTSGSSSNLKYAKRVAGVWITETVLAATIATNIVSTSLVELSSGHPGIAFFQTASGGSSTDIKFAEFNGSTWIFTIIDSDVIACSDDRFCAIVNAEPAVVYEGDPDTIMYARSSSWTIESIAIGGPFVSISQVGTDAAVCYNRGSDALYSPRSSGTWPETTVLSGANGRHFSLKEVDGDAAFSMYRQSPQNLLYAELNGTWSITTVDATTNHGEDTSLAIHNGAPAISYKGPFRNFELMAIFNGLTWDTEGISGVGGFGTSAASVQGVLPTSDVLAFVHNNNFKWLFEGCCC